MGMTGKGIVTISPGEMSQRRSIVEAGVKGWYTGMSGIGVDLLSMTGPSIRLVAYRYERDRGGARR